MNPLAAGALILGGGSATALHCSITGATLVRIPIGEVTGFAGFIDLTAGIHQSDWIFAIDRGERFQSGVLQVPGELYKGWMGGIDPLLNLGVCQLA